MPNNEITKDDLFNAKGKPLYPKYVENSEGKQVIVNTPDEESKIAKQQPSKQQPKQQKPEGWDKTV